MDEKRTNSDKFMLRLPDGMRDRIKAAAEANNRSMNAEVVSALEFWLGTLDSSEETPVPSFDIVTTQDVRRIIDDAVKEAIAEYARARDKME